MNDTKPKVHELEIEKQYLDALLSGEKTFELRYNDRNYQKGDILSFEDYSDYDNPKEVRFKVLSVFSGHPGFGLEHGWVILSVSYFKTQ
jgi:hypothetical protein